VADSLQSIEVEGNKQYWFVEKCDGCRRDWLEELTVHA